VLLICLALRGTLRLIDILYLI